MPGFLPVQVSSGFSCEVSSGVPWSPASVAAVLLTVPAVEVDVERHDAARRHAGHQRPGDNIIHRRTLIKHL